MIAEPIGPLVRVSCTYAYHIASPHLKSDIIDSCDLSEEANSLRSKPSRLHVATNKSTKEKRRAALGGIQIRDTAF